MYLTPLFLLLVNLAAKRPTESYSQDSYKGCDQSIGKKTQSTKSVMFTDMNWQKNQRLGKYRIKLIQLRKRHIRH